jgi:hypothetical protein
MDWFKENWNREPSIFQWHMGGFPINVPLNKSIESPQVFTGMCHCYRFVCYFCFANVFVCICLKPEAYTIAINCTDNDLSISLYVYWLYIYISIQQPSRWGWLCYYCLLARWSNCLWNWLFHVRIVPFPSVLCHTSVKFYLLLFAKSDLFDPDCWCCFNYMQVILSIFNDKGILSLILWHTWILLQSHLYDLAKSDR